jgi:hypothetical protein
VGVAEADLVEHYTRTCRRDRFGTTRVASKSDGALNCPGWPPEPLARIDAGVVHVECRRQDVSVPPATLALDPAAEQIG